jgi:aspartokinase/homoserine dehydrogenase 1
MVGAGVHVVTPNKKVGSGPLARYKECQAAVKGGAALWGYEVTVGAGLPICNLLKKDLLQTGDKVRKIEGIFSGTLSYLFNTFKPGMKFSEVIADANAKGFTEPDPRDDLGGVDVARKVCILARECGMEVELGDIPIKSLVPEALKDWKPAAGENMRDAFVREMAKFDDEKTALMAEADAKGMVLRFVGVVDVENKKCEVKLDMYPKTHSFAGTQWADNIVAFHTERYVPQPLVVQGPGAGAAVTAAGLYAECIKIIDRVH